MVVEIAACCMRQTRAELDAPNMVDGADHALEVWFKLTPEDVLTLLLVDRVTAFSGADAER